MFATNPAYNGVGSFRRHGEENATYGIGGSQWGDDEDYSVEGHDDKLSCGHMSSA